MTEWRVVMCGSQLWRSNFVNLIDEKHSVQRTRFCGYDDYMWKSRHGPHTSAKENMVWIRSAYPDPESGLFLKFIGEFLVRGYVCDKILMKIRPLSRSGVEKCPILQCWRIPQQIPGSRSGGGWLSKFSQFFLVHRYICGNFFAKIRWAVFC